MDDRDTLSWGRDAYAVRAWGDAYEALREADSRDELGADDLERLAMAAYMTGRDDDATSTLERLHHRAKSIGTVTLPSQTPSRPARRHRPTFVRTAVGAKTQKFAIALLLAFAAVACGGVPPAPEPGAGEVTGVVATGGFFRAKASDEFTVIAAFPVDGMDEFWVLLGGDADEIPEDRKVSAVMAAEREALEQIDGLIFADVEGSRFTLRGLDPKEDYWFCAGEMQKQDAPVRVRLAVCDKPEVDIPGSITAWSGQSSKILKYESP